MSEGRDPSRSFQVDLQTDFNDSISTSSFIEKRDQPKSDKKDDVKETE